MTVELHTGQERQKLEAQGKTIDPELKGDAKDGARAYLMKHRLYRPATPVKFDFKTGRARR